MHQYPCFYCSTRFYIRESTRVADSVLLRIWEVSAWGSWGVRLLIQELFKLDRRVVVELRERHSRDDRRYRLVEVADSDEAISSADVANAT